MSATKVDIAEITYQTRRVSRQVMRYHIIRVLFNTTGPRLPRLIKILTTESSSTVTSYETFVIYVHKDGPGLFFVPGTGNIASEVVFSCRYIELIDVFSNEILIY